MVLGENDRIKMDSSFLMENQVQIAKGTTRVATKRNNHFASSQRPQGNRRRRQNCHTHSLSMGDNCVRKGNKSSRCFFNRCQPMLSAQVCEPNSAKIANQVLQNQVLPSMCANHAFPPKIANQILPTKFHTQVFEPRLPIKFCQPCLQIMSHQLSLPKQHANQVCHTGSPTMFVNQVLSNKFCQPSVPINAQQPSLVTKFGNQVMPTKNVHQICQPKFSKQVHQPSFANPLALAQS